MLHDIRAIAPARTVLDWTLRLGGPFIDAERTALSVLRRLPSAEEEAPEAALLRRTRGAIRQARRSSWLSRLLGRLPSLPVPDAETDEALDQQWWRQQMQRVLDALSEREREVFVLVDLEGRSLPQAAALLGITTRTATERLHRGRQALDRALQRAEPVLHQAAQAQPWKPLAPLPSAHPTDDQIRRVVASTPEEVDHLVDAIPRPARVVRRPIAAAAVLIGAATLLWALGQVPVPDLGPVAPDSGSPIALRDGLPADPTGVWSLLTERLREPVQAEHPPPCEGLAVSCAGPQDRPLSSASAGAVPRTH